MEFACDPVETQAMDLSALLLSGAKSGRRRWLLIDAALLSGNRLDHQLRKLGWSSVNALALSPMAIYEDQAPRLILLPEDEQAAAEGLSRVLSIDAAAPAMSWFTSDATQAQLQALCAYLAQARTHDHRDVHCRFADTRILPLLLAELVPEQLQRVANLIAEWHWLDRFGQVASWSRADVTASISDSTDTAEHMCLTELQLNSMLRASEADGIFQILLEKTPEVVPHQGRAEFHGKLQRYLGAANDFSVSRPADRLQFVMLCLTCGENFQRHPGLAETWRAIAEDGASLVEQMQSWNDALWDELQAHREVA